MKKILSIVLALAALASVASAQAAPSLTTTAVGTASGLASGGLPGGLDTLASKYRADYTVKAGDTLKDISLAQYGDLRYWPMLYMTNKGVVANPELLELGLCAACARPPGRRVVRRASLRRRLHHPGRKATNGGDELGVVRSVADPGSQPTRHQRLEPAVAAEGYVAPQACEDPAKSGALGDGEYADGARLEPHGMVVVVTVAIDEDFICACLAGAVFHRDLIRKELTEKLKAARGCCVEIILKDISTVNHEPARLWESARIARETIEALT